MASQEDAIVSKNITPDQEDYIAYVAVGGIVPMDGGSGIKVSVEEFARKKGVNPSTLWRWRQSIPDFWERVDKERRSIGGKDRLSAVWTGVYLKAASGNAEAAKLYLKNFDPNYIDPSTKVEHDIGNGLTDLLASHRARVLQEERKVIDVTPSE